MTKQWGYTTAAIYLATLFLRSHNVGATDQGMQDFLDALRDFESGINPALADYYIENWNKPVFNYAQVTEPGHIVRDCSTGAFISEPTTVEGFFKKLGVLDMYDQNTPYNAEMFRKMQYNSFNAWGFVGYQIGEAVLIDAGYYSPPVTVVNGVGYDTFYIFVDDSEWIGCKTDVLVEVPGSGGNKVMATSINRWEGKFVGKNGVNSFEDILKPDKQELVIRDVMRFNFDIMSQLLEKAGMSWETALAKTWPGKDPETGEPIQIQATMSGLLAAAHLRGAWGAGALLTGDSVTCDELGTCITKYVHQFGGFNTIFDTPGDDIIEGSKYDESLSAGLGNDRVITGGGVDTIFIQEQAGSVTTIDDFTVGEDKIVVKDWANPDPLGDLIIFDTSEGVSLQFSGQTINLKGSSKVDIDNVGKAAVIEKSNVYTMAWTGTQVAPNFNPALDKVRGSSGIGFKHLKAYTCNSGESTCIGIQAADGGIYSYIELQGVKLSDLHAGMFESITGSFDRLGYIVELKWATWGWNVKVFVDNFDVSKTAIFMPVFEYKFAELKIEQEGADAVISLADGADAKRCILRNTNVSDLGARNFEGVSGDFSSSTIIGGNGGSGAGASTTTIVPNTTAQPTTSKASSSSTTTKSTSVKTTTAQVTTAQTTTAQTSTVQTTTAQTTVGKTTTAQTTQAPPNAGLGAPAPWQQGNIYVEGDRGKHEGYVYEAQWWTQGENPSNSGTWGVWRKVPTTTGGQAATTQVPTTVQSTGTAQTSSSMQSSSTPPQAGGPVPAWAADKVYWGGDMVSYGGSIYEAKWWTQGDTPSDTLQWGVWKNMGDHLVRRLRGHKK